jgi:hypothetical protein
LQNWKEAVSLIIFCDGPHSVPLIELLHHCQKSLGDPSVLSSPHAFQSNVSPDALMHFIEILGGTERYCSLQTFDDLRLLAREFGHNSLITRLVPQQGFPRREANIHKLLQELDRSSRGTTIEAEFHSIRDGFADEQRR